MEVIHTMRGGDDFVPRQNREPGDDNPSELPTLQQPSPYDRAREIARRGPEDGESMATWKARLLLEALRAAEKQKWMLYNEDGLPFIPDGSPPLGIPEPRLDPDSWMV